MQPTSRPAAVGLPGRAGGWAAAAVTILILAAAAWWLPFGIEPPGRDQSLFLAEAQALRAGSRLYTGIWEHKPPGIIVAYALADVLAGPGDMAFHLLDWVAGGLTALGLLVLVRRFTASWGAALGSALFYVAYHGGPVFGGFWARAQAEVVMDPWLVLALLALTSRTGSAAGAALSAAVAGFSVAVMLALKYSALPLVLLALPGSLGGGTGRRLLAIRVLAFFTALVLPILAWLAYLQWTDRLTAFWTATVTFNLAHSTVAKISRTEFFLWKVFAGFHPLLPLYVLAVAGMSWVLAARWRSQPVPAGASRLLLWGVFTWLLSLVAVFWQSKFWHYHYQVVLVPLCLAAGATLAMLLAWLPRTRHRVPAAAASLALIALCSLPYGRLVIAYNREHLIWPALRGAVDRRQFLATYRSGATDYDVLATTEAAESLRSETTPNDRIFVWGFEPGIYVQTQRRPASRFLYDYPLMPRFEAVHAEFMRQLMHDLETQPPARIVVMSRDPNDIEEKDSVTQLLDVPALRQFIITNYEPAWRQEDFWVLRRRAP